MTQIFDDEFYVSRLISELTLMRDNMVTLDQFLANKILAYGLIKCMENSGEAMKKLSEPLKAKYPQINWKRVQQLRNTSVHSFHLLNLERSWRYLRSISDLLPQLIVLHKTEFTPLTVISDQID